MNKMDMSKAGSIFGNGVPPDSVNEPEQEESTVEETAEETTAYEDDEQEVYQAYGNGELSDSYENDYDDDEEPLSNDEFFSQMEGYGVDTGRNRPAPETQEENPTEEPPPEQEEVFPDKENVKYAAKISEEKKKAEEERRSVVINGFRYILHVMGKGKPVAAEEDSDVPDMTLASTKVRTYKGLVKRPKTTYATPKDANGNPVKKIVMFLLVCVAVGIGAGLLGNSYAVSVGDDTISCMSALWNGLMGLESGLQIVTSPIYGSIFGMDFLIGFGTLALIGVFIYLDKEQKKLSRVGHEHGNARLGKNSDFKSFKKKFMD